MRYYKRMLLIFLSLFSAFALILVCVFLFSQIQIGREAFRNKMDGTSQMLTEYTELRLSSAMQYGSILLASEYTRPFLQKTEPVQYNRLMLYRFISRLFGAVTVSQNGLAISTLNEDYVIRNDGTGSIQAFLWQFSMTQEQLDGLIGNFYKSYIAQTSFLKLQNTESPAQYVIARYEPTLLYNTKTPLYIFVSLYEEQLFDMDALEDGGFAIFYLDELVASAGGFPHEVFEEINAGHTPKNLDTRIIPSALSGYHYIYVSAQPPTMNSAILIMILVGVLALLCAVYLSIFLAKRMYIISARELLGLTDNEEPDDEFAYIRKTVLSLSDGVETRSSSMEQYNELIENAFFQDLLNTPMPKTHYSDAMRQFLPYSVLGPFMAVLIRYNQSGMSQPDLSQNIEYILKQNIDVYLKPVIDYCRYAKRVDTSFDHTVLILACDDIPGLCDRLNDALLQAESKHKLDFTAAVGSPVDRIDDISLSHRQAKHLLSNIDFWGNEGKVVTQESVKPANRTAVYFPLDLERALYVALSQGKTEVWMEIIDTIIVTNQNERDPNMPQLTLMFAACANRILDALQIDLADIWGEDANPYLEFRSASTFDALREKANELFERLSERIGIERKELHPAMLKKMQQFIEENYHKNISLIDLADHLSLSKNYVSTLFKNSVGSNFKDYLNNMRFRKACEVFEKNPNVKIKEVARQVGCNSDILARLFMKYAGTLPHEYLEKLKRKKA